MSYSRNFDCLKHVTEKLLVVKVPMHQVSVNHLVFQSVSYNHQQIVLTFQRLPHPVAEKPKHDVIDREVPQPRRTSYHWGDYLE
jgi:hypothetical protein